MLGAFFDDSGTDSRSPVVVIGGLLGTEEQWDVFEAQWNRLLKNPVPTRPPLKQFHLGPCRARQGEFADHNLAERDRVTYRFRSVILEIGFVTLAVAVDAVAWRELVVGDVAERLGKPEEYCLVTCIKALINTIRSRKPGEKVAIFIDKGVRDSLSGWADFYRSQRDMFPEIDCFAYAPVRRVIALQGADMIATETFQYAREWLKQGEDATANPHFRPFIGRELTSGFMCGRNRIEDLVAYVKERHA